MNSVGVRAGRSELSIDVGIRRLFLLVQLSIKKTALALYPCTDIFCDDQVAYQLLQIVYSDRMDRHIFHWMRPPSSPRGERR